MYGIPSTLTVVGKYLYLSSNEVDCFAINAVGKPRGGKTSLLLTLSAQVSEDGGPEIQSLN